MYIYNIWCKIILKFRWERGFLRGFHGTPLALTEVWVPYAIQVSFPGSLMAVISIYIANAVWLVFCLDPGML